MTSVEEPPHLAPMAAGMVGMPHDPAGWLFEPKWDGVRAIARMWDGHLTLTSRLGNEVTGGYPELAALATALDGRAAVLDGEIVAFDDRGRPSFERLQSRMHVRNPTRALMAEVPVLYVLFDLLWLDGRLLTGEPLTERRAGLAGLGLKGPNWQMSMTLDGVPDDELLDACRRAGLEGYVGKQRESIYLPGRRSKAWTKVKAVRRREFVVGAWSEGSGGRSGRIGSLGVGFVDPEVAAEAGYPFALRYAGQVGSGLNEALLRRLSAAFKELATATSPFVPPPVPPKGLHYVQPRLVVEVTFNELTRVGILRQPSLKGLRDDIDPSAVVWTEELR
ncbi:MAG: non-homologous end-joining DNA ligase [Acidimicrobiales bacterium]